MPHDFVRDIIPPDERPRQPKRTIEPEMLEDEVMDAHSQPTPPDRSIRNVQMPSKVRPSVAPTIIREHVREQRPPVRRGTDWRRYALFAVAFLILSAVGFMGMLAIGKTTVTIVPRSQSVVFSDRTTITAAPEKAETSTGLTYQTLSQTAEDNALVKSSGVQQVEETASGYVMLFNNFSDAPVKLVKTTRLESTTGLIYRIKDDVSIPGRASGKPGSVSVMAFAENTGEQYNSAAIANMTLPGLKTSKTGMYETVYASAPQGFSGGFKGNRPGVDDATLTATRTTLRSDLETKARAALLAAVPAGSYLAPSLITVSFVSC